MLLPITLVAQLYMVTGRAGRYARECAAYYRGGYLYVSDQLGILTEQPEGEGSSEASIMAKRGGTSHCHQPGRHCESICSIDITSQYPAAMIYMRIPKCESKWVRKFHESAYGYYHVTDIVWNPARADVNGRIMKPVAELKPGESTLKWDDPELDSAYIDSELMKYLLEHKYILDYKIKDGLVSEHYMTGETLFGAYVNTFFGEKKLQDALKDAKDEEYNNAYRETIKLFLNAVTGKLQENPANYTSVTYLSKQDFEPKRGNNLHGLAIEKTPNATRPYNLWVNAGCMVYSYSKRHLYEYIHCLPNNNCVIHIETDAIYFPTKYESYFNDEVKNYVDVRQEFPVAFGDNLGHIKAEHKTQGDSHFLGKKFYRFNCIHDGEILKCRGIRKETIPQKNLSYTQENIAPVRGFF